MNPDWFYSYLKNPITPDFANDESVLIKGDCLEVLTYIQDESIDLIFADPPYFLSNGGITCKSGKMAKVDKGEWDKSYSLSDKHSFNKNWICECKRILSPKGSIWISGTLHNIYSIGMALEEEGFVILNNITWRKTNPPPNLGCRCFTHSTETILWACKKETKSKHYFDYISMKEINGGKQMKDVWEGPLTSRKEKKEGKHPTQKPLYLLDRIILATSKPGDTILDPFAGSSTTGVAANKLGRKFIGIEKESEFFELSIRRLKTEN